MQERDACWIALHDDLRFLRESDRFVWASERDGFKHLYLYELNGHLMRQLTRGPWPVKEVVGVDEKQGMIYLTGWMESPPGKMPSQRLRGSSL